MPKILSPRGCRSPRNSGKVPYEGGNSKALHHEILLHFPRPPRASLPGSRRTNSSSWNSPVPALIPDTSDCGSFIGYTPPTTPFSEASTIVHDALPKLSFDDCDFEFKQIIQVEGDKCQVSWLDTSLSSVELEYGTLHGKSLLRWIERVQPSPPDATLGDTDECFRITWRPTWEPVETFNHFLRDMSSDPRFETFELCDYDEGEADGKVRTRFLTCIVHESLLDTAMVDGEYLRDLVHSETRLKSGADNYDDDLVDFLEVTWSPVWRDVKTWDDFE